MMSKLDEIIHIAFITDENFALPTGVALTSLAKNRSEDSRYQVYVMCNGVSNEMKERFLTCSRDGFSVQVKDLDGFEDLESIEQRTEHVSKTAMFKFQFPDLFPELDKLLYLDGDILILNDLKNLYDTDIEQYYVAAVRDMAPVVKYKPHVGKKLNLPDSYIYFNSGVMLFNLRLMRKHNVADRLMTYRKNGKNFFMDQDAFNVILGARVRELPIQFNNQITIYEQFSTAQIANFFGIPKRDVGKTQVKDATILHLTSKTKPWKYNLPYYTELFRSYQRQSTFSDIELSLLPYPVEEPLKSPRDLAQKFVKTLKKEGPKAALKKFREWLSAHKNHPKLKPIYGPYHAVKTHIRRIYLWFKEGKVLKTQCTQALYGGEPREKPIIVSLTSFPGRIHEVPTTVLALLQQTVKPDRITLWLTPEEFPGQEKDLPRRLTRLKDYGLEICWGENLRAHTKYYHVMKANPDAIVITVDDDIHYDNNLIEILYRSYEKHPNAVSAARVHLMTFGPDGELEDYTDWKYQYCGMQDTPSMWLFATGVGGVLYPPHCMHEEKLNIENLKKYSFAADDVWLKFMQIMNHTPVVFCGNPKKLEFVGDTQSVGLCYSNVQGGGNDVMIRAMIDHYNYFFGKDDTLMKRLREADKRFCPACLNEMSAGDVVCPCCGATSRDRLFALYFRNKTNLLKTSRKRILHFQPERWLNNQLSREEYKHDYYPVAATLDYPDYIRAVIDIEKIQFPRDTFDVVIARKAFRDTKDEVAAITEIKRVLKKGATAFLGAQEEMNASHQFDFIERMKNTGFTVKAVNYIEDLTEEEKGLYQLPNEEGPDAVFYLFKK